MNDKRALWIIPLLLTVMVGNAISQPQLLWQRHYGGQDEDGASGIVNAPNGGFLVTGYDESFGAVEWDGWVVRLDANGDTLWTREAGGDHWDFLFKGLAVDGGYITAGRSASWADNGYEKTWLVKFDDQGNQVWSRYFGSAQNYYVLGLKPNADGGFSISGRCDENNGDFFLQKFDAQAQLVWEANYGSDQDDYGFSNAPTADGGFILCGQTESYGALRSDAMLLKVDANHQEQWHHLYGGREIEEFTDVVQTADGGYAAVGVTNSFGGPAGWLVRTDANGDTLWTKFFGSSQAWLTQILPANDGGFYLVGTDDYEAYLVRVTDRGEIRWEGRYRLNTGYSMSAVVTPDGGFALTYETQNDVGIARLGPDPMLGIPQWGQLPLFETNEDHPLQIPVARLLDFVQDNAPDSLLVISAANGNHVTAEIVADTLIITPAENWWGRDSLQLTATDTSHHSAQAWLSLIVHPMNDLPEPFALLNPEDGLQIFGHQLAMMWETARQNQFEVDSVHYRLRFEMGERSVEFSGLRETNYLVRDVVALLDSLGADSGQVAEVRWSVFAVDDSGETRCNAPFIFSFLLPGNSVRGEGSRHPVEFGLLSARPNPFNATTEFSYGLDHSMTIRLDILDQTGRQIADLAGGFKSAGNQTVTWNAMGLPAGIYFARLRSEDGRQAMTKLVLLK